MSETFAKIHVPDTYRTSTGALCRNARRRVASALIRRWGANPVTGARVVGYRDGALTVSCSQYHAGQGYDLRSALEAEVVAALLASGREVTRA